MEPNDVDQEKPFLREALAQLSDHLDLAVLEWSYEKKQSIKTLTGVGVAVFLAFFAFALVQVGLLHYLMKAGLSLGEGCFLLAGIYVVVAAIAASTLTKRDPLAGKPFEASRREVKASIQWIQKHLS